MDKDYIVIGIIFVIYLIASTINKVFFNDWFGFILLGWIIGLITLVLIVAYLLESLIHGKPKKIVWR